MKHSAPQEARPSLRTPRRRPVDRKRGRNWTKHGRTIPWGWGKTTGRWRLSQSKHGLPGSSNAPGQRSRSSARFFPTGAGGPHARAANIGCCSSSLLLLYSVLPLVRTSCFLLLPILLYCWWRRRTPLMRKRDDQFQGQFPNGRHRRMGGACVREQPAAKRARAPGRGGAVSSSHRRPNALRGRPTSSAAGRT